MVFLVSSITIGRIFLIISVLLSFVNPKISLPYCLTKSVPSSFRASALIVTGKQEKPLWDKYYLSIEELPVFNWWKLHEKNDFKQVLRDKKDKIDERVIEVVKELQNEFITTFGIDENYAQYLRKQIQIELLKIKVLKTGDRSFETMIDILEIELEDLTRKEEDKGMSGSTIAIEKWMGFKLDTSKISTFEYYSYIKAITKATNGRK